MSFSMGRELRESVEFLIRPGKVMEKMGMLPLYFSLPFLFILRYFHFYLHGLLVHLSFYRAEYPNLFSFFWHEFDLWQGFLLPAALFSLPAVLWWIGRVMGRKVDYRMAEHGAFHVLVAGVLLVPFDAIHLWLSPTYLWGHCMHLSLLLQLLLLPYWMSVWAEKFLGVKKRYSFLPFLLFPLSIKYADWLVLSPPFFLLLAYLVLTLFFLTGERERLGVALGLSLCLWLFG